MTLIIENNILKIKFQQPWDNIQYDLFLKSKKLPESELSYDRLLDTYTLSAPARFAHVFGLDDNIPDRAWLPLPDFLFDYQCYIVRIALQAKRYAVWADTGLGKTLIYLEFARQVTHRTGGRVLLIVPLNIIQQTIDEASLFYGSQLSIERLESRAIMREWCRCDDDTRIGIVNPDKFIARNNENETISEIKYLRGVVLDEASILKAGGGKTKWALIKSCRGIEYKLSCTATPAPNDTMEYASQGSFLEKLRNEGEILWTFFCRDKFGNWKIKDHAAEAFYRFMAGWSIYLRDPKNYGFADNLKDLPSPDVRKYKLHTTPEQRKIIMAIPDDDTGQLSLFENSKRIGITERSKYSQLAKGFVYEGSNRRPLRIRSWKPEFVADLIKKEINVGLQVLVWTVFDEEGEIISEHLPEVDHQLLTGKTQKSRRIDIIEQFRTGKLPVLVSKASMLGFGLNFQNCGSMIFSGFNDSFEQFYQAVRRAYRYGQTRRVRVHIPFIPELEGVVWQNILQKQAKFQRDTTIQEHNYRLAMKDILNAA